jgi:hypothetical protein
MPNSSALILKCFLKLTANSGAGGENQFTVGDKLLTTHQTEPGLLGVYCSIATRKNCGPGVIAASCVSWLVMASRFVAIGTQLAGSADPSTR